MNRRLLRSFAAAALLAGGIAHAFIERLYSLQEVMDESSHIYVGRIERVDEKRRVVLGRVERALKGKADFGLVRMNMSIGPKEHAAYIFAAIKEGLPFILYAKRDGRNIASLVHCGDIWFQLFATAEAKLDETWWRMSHVEIHMGRTFNGATTDLIRITGDVAAGRAKPPKADPSVPRVDVGKLKRPAAVVQPQPPPPEPIDGLEAITGWVAESGWARAATLAAENTTGGGTVLRARCEGVADKKLAISLVHHVDLSGFTQFGALVDNASDKPIEVAVAFGAAPTWAMFEAPPVTVPPNAKAAAIRFPITVPYFKAEASKWEYTQPMPNNGRVDKVMLLVEGLPAKGSVAFDRIGPLKGGGFRLLAEFRRPPGGEVRGLAWTDVNANGWLDLLACSSQANLLLVNEGGAFSDRSAAFGLAAGSRAAAWADYSGDGRPDLLTHAFKLFTQASVPLRDDSRLIPTPKAQNPEGIGWIDYNGDGLPDILITNGEHGICLFENTGKGPNWFRDVSDRVGLGPRGIGVGNGDFIAFADYDGDGYTDFLYNLGDGVLAHNEGGKRFVLDTRSGIKLPGGSEHKRGVVFADFDNDGYLDLFVPGPARPHLYRNNGDGTFTNLIAAAGDLAKIADPTISAAWGDVNNDGNLDLFVCFAKAPGRLYLGDGKGGFTDSTAAASLDKLPPAFAASFADLDNDGDLDLALSLDGRVALLANDLDRMPGRAHLVVRVLARRGVIGAVARVADAQGRPLGLREIGGAEGLGGQAPPVALFAVPLGKCQLAVCLTDGRVAQRDLAIPPTGLKLALGEDHFK